MERLINVDRSLDNDVERLVEALVAKGAVGEKDDIRVVLEKDNPKLSTHGKKTKIEVTTVFRDGKRGPMEAITEIYTVEFP